MLRFAAAIAFFVAFAAPGARADELVLSGLPSTKIESTSESTSRVQLSPAQAQEYSAVIVKRGERYLWASRQNRALQHHLSGPCHYFIDPKGGGYLKVDASPGGEPVDYFEHVNLGLGTITYWGTSATFSP